MSHLTIAQARLRTLQRQRGLYRIGIEVSENSFPCRLYWRDSFTGESGLLCRCSRFALIESIKAVLAMLADIRLNQPDVFVPAAIENEMTRRYQKAKKQQKFQAGGYFQYARKAG